MLTRFQTLLPAPPALDHSAAYIKFRIIMSFRKPCQMPFRKLIQPFTLTVAYESFKSKLTSYSPVNPVSVRGRLRECKNPCQRLCVS